MDANGDAGPAEAVNEPGRHCRRATVYNENEDQHNVVQSDSELVLGQERGAGTRRAVGVYSFCADGRSESMASSVALFQQIFARESYMVAVSEVSQLGDIATGAQPLARLG